MVGDTLRMAGTVSRGGEVYRMWFGRRVKGGRWILQSSFQNGGGSSMASTVCLKPMWWRLVDVPQAVF